MLQRGLEPRALPQDRWCRSPVNCQEDMNGGFHELLGFSMNSGNPCRREKLLGTQSSALPCQ